MPTIRGGKHKAINVTVEDSGNNFTGTDVESVLAEIVSITGPETLAHSDLTDMPDLGGTNTDHDARYIRLGGGTITTDIIPFAEGLTAGSDGAGADVKFFGATSGKYFLWDESADTLEIKGNITAQSTGSSSILTLNSLNFGGGIVLPMLTTDGIAMVMDKGLFLRTGYAGGNTAPLIFFDTSNSLHNVQFVFNKSANTFTLSDFGATIPFTVNMPTTINGTFTTNSTILAKDKIAFTQTDLNEYIDSEADGFMDYGATTAHRFRIGGSQEIAIAADTLTFEAGASDPVLNWSTSGVLALTAGIFRVDDKLVFTQTDNNEYIDSENDGGLDIAATTNIDFNLGGSQLMTLASNKLLTFNNPTLATALSFGTSHTIDFQVNIGFGLTTEMSLTNDLLTFNNGATTTALQWNTNAQLDFKVGTTIEAVLSASGFDVTNVVRAESFAADGDAGGQIAAKTMTGVLDTPTTDPGWTTSSTVNMNAPDGYFKFYDGSQAVVVPFWNT